MAIEEDLSEWEIAPTWRMVAFGFGYIFVNWLLSYGLANVFYFYQVEIGLNVIYVGVAYAIFAIWNMVNDPLLGYFTDKPLKWTPKYGLRAPWVVVTTIPVLVFFYLIWIPPQGAGAMVIFIWFIIFTCLHDTFFSIYNDHIYGGFTNQFPSEYERRRAFAIVTIMLFIVLTFMTILSSQLIVYGNPDSFVMWSVVMIILLAIYSIVIFPGVRESEEMKQMFLTAYEKADETSFFTNLKIALKTKNFRVSLCGYTITLTATTLFGGATIYYFRYIYGIPFTMTAIPALFGVVASLAMIPFWSNYARKHGFKKCYATAYIIHGFLFLPFLFTFDIITHTIFYVIYNMVYIGEVTMLMPVASDTYDEVSSNVGRRVDASLVGIRTFFFRVALLVQAIVFTVIFLATGFNPNTETQTLQAQMGIRVAGALIPAILMITMGFIFRKYYTLEGEEKMALVRKLKDLGIYR